MSDASAASAGPAGSPATDNRPLPPEHSDTSAQPSPINDSRPRAGDLALDSPGPPPEQIQRSARELAIEAVNPSTDPPVAPPTSNLLEDTDVPRWSVQEIFDASPLSEWFPGVSWRTLMQWLGGVAFQSDDADPITLLVQTGDTTPAGSVLFTNSEPWTHGVVGWFGPEVTSAAEVGELLVSDTRVPGSPLGPAH